MSKPALGRGLSALLGGKPPAAAAVAPSAPAETTAVSGTATRNLTTAGEIVERIPIASLKASSLQPRREFPAGSLQELADSIREQGILQPLVVRRRGDSLELIAGERRWRAAQLIGLVEVPVIIREVDDTTALELMLVENLQREGLNPMDEAQGFSELIERFRLTQESVATKVGRSRVSVTNALRLLKLPAAVQALVRSGQVSNGHAKVILGLPSPELQSRAARRVADEGLSVRQTEEWVAHLQALQPPPGAAQRAPSPVTLRDPHVAAAEDRLRQRLGTRVTLRYRQGRGQIDIRFSSDDELQRVLEVIGAQPE